MTEQNDLKSITTASRVEIGFPTQEGWCKSAPIFTEDALKIADHPVMERWETQYMSKLADIATSRGGSVLELGYGMGISAGFIESQPAVKSHYIIECHPDVIAKCLTNFRDAINESRIHILTGFWQMITPFLADGTFDGILFDTYPLAKEEIHQNHFCFFKEAYRLLKPGGVFTYYSDEAEDFAPEHYARLLDAGFKAENISAGLCEVNPPEECEYWKAKTIMVPVIIKE